MVKLPLLTDVYASEKMSKKIRSEQMEAEKKKSPKNIKEIENIAKIKNIKCDVGASSADGQAKSPESLRQSKERRESTSSEMRDRRKVNKAMPRGTSAEAEPRQNNVKKR